VDGEDIGVRQRSQQAGFALETRSPFRIAREQIWKDLDGDLTTELRVVRAVDLAHAARANETDIS